MVRGDQEKGKESLRRDSPTGSLLGAHVVSQTAASKHWPLRSLDAKNAYFQGEKLSRVLILRQPKRGLPDSSILADDKLLAKLSSGS